MVGMLPVGISEGGIGRLFRRCTMTAGPLQLFDVDEEKPSLSLGG